jgi:beta-lactamase class D
MNTKIKKTLALLLLVQTVTFSEETFLLMDGASGKITFQKGEHIHSRISPCSTFKIPLSLMGFDTNILINESTPAWPFKEGYENFLSAWTTIQTPTTWMQYSCIWYSKILANQIGHNTIHYYLQNFEYGNMDISSGLGNDDPSIVSWINASLQISPFEQVIFLRDMVNESLPIKKESIYYTKKLLYRGEIANGWLLYGKTGWSGSDITKDGLSLEHSWFVGWIEKDHQRYIFAFLNKEQSIDLERRVPRVKELILESKILK